MTVPDGRSRPDVHPGWIVAVLAAVAAAYARAFAGGFLLDDQAHVLDHPAVHAATPANAWYLLTHDYWEPLGAGGLYRPLTSLSFLVDYAVLGSGDRPAGYHATNLVMHLGCVLLLFAVVRHLAGRTLPGLVAAALFGLHPLATEAVTYVAGRADPLAALGVLGGLACHLAAPGSPGGERLRRVGLVAAAVVACAAKETGLVLVPLVALAVAWLGDGRRRGDLAIVGAVAALWLAARVAVALAGPPFEPIPRLDNPLVDAGILPSRLTALGVTGRALGLIVWPANLRIDYSCCAIPVLRWPPAGMDAARVAAGAAVLAGAVAWGWWARRRWPAGVLLLALAIGAWVPASNLLVRIGTVFAERTLYLPLAGLAGFVALGIDRLRPTAAAVATGVAAIVAVAGGLRTAARNADYAEPLRLWATAAGATPPSAKALAEVAALRFEADPAHGDLDDVIALAERGVETFPTHVQGLVDLGWYHAVRGDRAAARMPAGASTLDPDAAAEYTRAADLLSRAVSLDAGDLAAWRARRAAAGAGPTRATGHGNHDAYLNLAAVDLRLGRPADALEILERSRRIDPTAAQAYVDLATVLRRLDRWEDAATMLFAAVTLDPGRHDASMALVELYRAKQGDGHAVLVDDPTHVRVNVADPDARRHRCAALAVVAQAYADVGDAARAEQSRAQARSDCPG